jgi:hypothetical protein
MALAIDDLVGLAKVSDSGADFLRRLKEIGSSKRM